MDQLAELSQRIFDSSNRSFVNKVKVLQDSNCADFADYTGKKSYLLFGIIATYHKWSTICEKSVSTRFLALAKGTKVGLQSF